MKSNQVNNYNWLFKVSVRCLKYYGYFFLGLVSACLLTSILGIFPIMQLIFEIAGEWILRMFGVVLALTLTATIYESLRY